MEPISHFHTLKEPLDRERKLLGGLSCRYYNSPQITEM